MVLVITCRVCLIIGPHDYGFAIISERALAIIAHATVSVRHNWIINRLPLVYEISADAVALAKAMCIDPIRTAKEL
jgi:hypothetical protein